MSRSPKKLGTQVHPARGDRVAALLRRREIAALKRTLSRHGARAWIVGGALRDLLLDREVLDVDVAVHGNVERLAQELEKQRLGRAVCVSASQPRVFRLAGRRELDLAEIDGPSIEEDLKRRDFTVNAMALDLSSGSWTDPFAGARDLARRRLRRIDDRNLEDDPLRTVRAARLMATHGLTPDAETTRACRRAAPGVASAAPERVRVELAKLFEAPEVRQALAWAIRVGVLAPALAIPLPLDMRRRLARHLPLLDAPHLRRAPEPARRRIRLALLCAALGLGSGRAANWLAARRWGREEAADVARLLELLAAARAAQTADAKWRWVRDSGSRREEALNLLALLDPAGRARATALARLRPPRRRPRVRGADVLTWLGIPPGPAVGELLRRLEVEILRGRVRTRTQARNWLRASP